MQLNEEVVPALLSGPDPAQMLRDSPEDADKPAIQIRVPSDEEIAKYLPQGMPNALLLPVAPPSSMSQTSTQPLNPAIPEPAAAGVRPTTPQADGKAPELQAQVGNCVCAHKEVCLCMLCCCLLS